MFIKNERPCKMLRVASWDDYSLFATGKKILKSYTCQDLDPHVIDTDDGKSGLEDLQ